MPLKLTLLGTGTPTPLVHRAGSGYLVTFDEETLLFDCGPWVASIRSQFNSPCCQSMSIREGWYSSIQ